MCETMARWACHGLSDEKGTVDLRSAPGTGVEGLARPVRFEFSQQLQRLPSLQRNARANAFSLAAVKVATFYRHVLEAFSLKTLRLGWVRTLRPFVRAGRCLARTISSTRRKQHSCNQASQDGATWSHSCAPCRGKSRTYLSVREIEDKFHRWRKEISALRTSAQGRNRMKQEIRTVIADDEPLARRMLRALLEKDSQITVIAEARDGAEAEEVVRRLEPDLLMLDVQMPGGDGFRALRDLEKLPVLIFITAHPEHAIKAFDYEAVDYLLKPFDDQRFERALARAKAAVRARELVDLVHAVAQDTPSLRRPQEDRTSDRLALNEGRRIVMVDIRDIDWVEAADYYAQVHVRNTAHLIRESLLDLEKRLGPKRFVRIHRNALVNMDRVHRLERLDDGELFAVLIDGTRLKISRSRRQIVSSLLNAP